MVQVIQGSPSFGDLLLQANLGEHFEKGYDKAKKQSLLDKISDPNATEIERASAEESYLRKFGKPKDIIDFRKSQKRDKAISNLEKLMNQGNEPAQEVTGNTNPLFGPPSDSAFKSLNTPRQRVPNSSELNKAILDVGQVDPQYASLASRIVGQGQKESLANQRMQFDQNLAQQEQDLKKQKFQQSEIQRAQEQKNFNTKLILPIQQESNQKLEASNKQLFALDNMEAAVRSGATDVFSKGNLSSVLKSLDSPVFQALGRAAETEGSAIFKTSSKQIFTGLKDIWGARPSNFDTSLFNEMVPEIGRNQLANEIAIDTLKAPIADEVEKQKYTQRLIGEQPDIDPQTLNYKIFNHMEAYRDSAHASWLKKIEAWKLGKKKKTTPKAFPKTEKATPSKEKPKQSLEEFRNEYFSK